jgi:hydrogenase maturation protease
MKRVLVAGVGNLFLGDDAFGVEVVRELQRHPTPPNVTLRDFGTRGLDLAYALADGVDGLLLVDVVQRGYQPGTLTVLTPDFEREHANEEFLGPGHGVDPCRVYDLVRALGGTMPETRLLGCEPLSFGSDDEPMLTLSAPVRDAVGRSLPLIEQLVLELGDDSSGGVASDA